MTDFGSSGAEEVPRSLPETRPQPQPCLPPRPVSETEEETYVVDGEEGAPGGQRDREDPGK